MSPQRFSLFIVACIVSLTGLYAGTKRALIFGLGKYEDNSWGKIHGDADVYYVKQMLGQCGYTDIRTLTNEKATKEGMVQAFLELTDRCRKGDDVYVHYSGHGQLMTDLDGDEALRTTARHGKWDESWIPYDAYMTYCEKDGGEKHFCDDEVAMFLEGIRQKIGDRGRLTVVIDACHSGDATCGSEDECVRGIDTKFNIPRSGNEPRVTHLKEEHWQTISACKPYQLCTEMKNLKIGKLTSAVISLGSRLFTMSNEVIQAYLDEYIEMNKGRLPQNPMVSGLP